MEDVGGRSVGSNLLSLERFLGGGWLAFGRERSEGGGGVRFAGVVLGTESSLVMFEGRSCWDERKRSHCRILVCRSMISISTGGQLVKFRLRRYCVCDCFSKRK